MTRLPHALWANDPLSKAVELTLSTPQSDFPVMEAGNGKLAGVLTEGDLLKGLQAYGATARVSQVMTTRHTTAAPDDPLYQAQQQMATRRARAMPVVEKSGRLVGLLTADDINEAYRLLSVSPKQAPAT